MNLKVSLGKGFDSKKEVSIDLQKDNIHTVVISGSTGSGKSTFHHAITKQIMKNNTPKEVGFIFMDFKRVEFGEYKNSEYLYHSIIYDPKEAVVVLKDLIKESEARFKGVQGSEKAIIVHIEESDIVHFSPNLLEEVFKAIEEQLEGNNIYVFFSSSRVSDIVFTPRLLKYSALKGVFISKHLHTTEINKYVSMILNYSFNYFINRGQGYFSYWTSPGSLKKEY